MKDMIRRHLGLIEKSIMWIERVLHGETRKKARDIMINNRRKLKTKMFALESNPAAATFGESQAGKSYLVSALLSEQGKPFKVLDGYGREFDFKGDINPRGNEVESTSLVTRFSMHYKTINNNYPVIAKMLSPADIILLICEAYYHNLNGNNALSKDETQKHMDLFVKEYTNHPECQRLIMEDDILDIGEYFSKNFSARNYTNIRDVGFFEEISRLATKIPDENWKDVFSLLWNRNSHLTRLFGDLITQYKRLSFSETVYLPMNAVLREEGTLLDVTRLDEIYSKFNGDEKKYTAETEVFFKDKDGSDKTITFSKPYLCALMAEIIFVLPDTIKREKPFLNETDLLDFPGTRRFENTNEENISDKSLTNLLRRGKVDYLFNKYSSCERVNALLFCQNHKQSSQSVMPEKLNRWIKSMIGKTPEEREEYKSQVSPLFVISTWFNKDLEYGKNKRGDSFDARWNQRFNTVLADQIFKIHENDWFTRWTTSQPNFQNIFLLRDFEKSGIDVENCSNLFRGYNENNEEQEEIKPKDYEDFRKDLEQSFVKYKFVCDHFENPKISWDSAASINQDGTRLIIEKLTVVANNINPARINKTRGELNEILRSTREELNRHFHSDDKDKILENEKNKAGRIQFEFDTAFGSKGIKDYGLVMRELSIDESSVLKLYRTTIDNIERDNCNQRIEDPYTMIKRRVPIERDSEGKVIDTKETYFERARNKYNQTAEEFSALLERRNVDLEWLLKESDTELIKTNAQYLAEELLQHWLDHVQNGENPVIRRILNNGGSSDLQEVTVMFEKMFKKLNFAKRIAEKIRPYIDEHGKTGIPYETIADISAELLNKFVNTVGFEYLDEAALTALREANQKNNLELIMDKEVAQTGQTIEELFTMIHNWIDDANEDSKNLGKLPSVSSSELWLNRLKAGFVYVCDIPNYDPKENAKLGNIIDECNIGY